MSEAQVWHWLKRNLEERMAAFPGSAGLALLDLRGSEEIAIDAGEVLPTASTIKIAILAHLLERAEQGAVDLDRRLVVDASQRAPGSGVLAYFEDPVELTVRDVAVLMIDVSDNTATNLCIDWATIDGVNAMLRKLGLSTTTLRRRMQDAAAIARGEENVATPAEVVELLRRLFCEEGLSRSVCQETLRILRKPKHGYFQPGLPEDIEMANKPGAMGRVRNDAAIVYLPRRPYALCVMTARGSVDRIPQERLIADVAATVHERLSTLDATNQFGQALPPT
jgi:beta-lactamase class A